MRKEREKWAWISCVHFSGHEFPPLGIQGPHWEQKKVPTKDVINFVFLKRYAVHTTTYFHLISHVCLFFVWTMWDFFLISKSRIEYLALPKEYIVRSRLQQ